MPEDIMRVLMVAGKSELGGAPKSMLEMIKTLKDKYSVEFIVLVHKDGEISKYCRENGIQYCVDGHEPIVLGKGSTMLRRIGKLLLYPFYTWRMWWNNYNALRIIEKEIDLNKIDLIHTNSNRDGIGALISQKYGIKHVWHIREFGKEDYDTVFMLPYNIEFMNKSTSNFIMISKALAEAWEVKGIASSKIVQVYNGINMKKIVSDKERISFTDEKIKMVFTGTICPAKGQIEIIEALGLLKDEIRARLSLDFYGDGAVEYVELLKKRVRELKLDSQVKFCGFCSNIGKVLQNYNVGVVCSRAEAFGRITPEYMAAGLIVIASDTGANIELIEDGKSGFFYHLHDYRNLAMVIQNLCDLPIEERINMSLYAEEVARKNFTAEINADKIFSLYKAVNSR